MENIFDSSDSESLLERIERLTAESKPEWGKMTVSQMMWHCQRPMEVATQKLKLKRGLFGILFGRIAKKGFLKKRGFDKNLPTVPEFKPDLKPEFENEKRSLTEMVRQFGQAGPKVLATNKHPFFGEMSDDEWGQLLYLHTDHHLRQFGV